MEKFEEIIIKYECPKRIEKPISTINQIEGFFKFKLPIDYKYYIENYLGFEACIGLEFIRLWDFDELIEINKDYDIKDSLPNTLGIGGNGGGEFIAIELTGENQYRIVLSPFTTLDRNDHIEIGTSFTDFLVRLEKGQEWFE